MLPATTLATPSLNSALPRRQRRASDITAARLGRATLGYLTVMMGIITLAPFHFAAAPVHGLSPLWTVSDIVMNVLMFLPFGFVYQLTRPSGAPASMLRVLCYGALLSACVETAQLFEAERYSSLVDVTTNAIGAVVGAYAYGAIVRRIEGENAVRSLALELPLMALVYLMVPLSWLTGLVSAYTARGWLALPIAIFAGSVLGTVQAAYLAPTRGVARGWLLLGAALWFVVAIVPSVRGNQLLLIVSAVATVGSAWLCSVFVARYRLVHGEQRFELRTLRLVMPLFASYLALSSLWPIDIATAPWRGSLALIPADAALTTRAIYLLLEHFAAFTLVGYIIAEFYGRDLARYREVAPRVIAWGGCVSVLLEVTRGFHPLYGASLLTFGFTIASCVVGGWIYQLQREHVRALLRRRGTWSLKTGNYTPIVNDRVDATLPLSAPIPSAPIPSAPIPSAPIPSHEHAPTFDRRTA